MAKRKIPVGRDQQMEKLSQVQVTSCAAFYDPDEGSLRIIGEMISTSGIPVDDYREVQAAIYDADGEIIERSFSNWVRFGLRQSFEIELSELPSEPARVDVYPSGMDSLAEEDSDESQELDGDVDDDLHDEGDDD